MTNIKKICSTCKLKLSLVVSKVVLPPDIKNHIADVYLCDECGQYYYFTHEFNINIKSRPYFKPSDQEMIDLNKAKIALDKVVRQYMKDSIRGL